MGACLEYVSGGAVAGVMVRKRRRWMGDEAPGRSLRGGEKTRAFVMEWWGWRQDSKYTGIALEIALKSDGVGTQVCVAPFDGGGVCLLGG